MEKEFQNNFKNNLRRLRKLYNVSQKKLGKDLNFANSTICDWEHGLYEPDYDTIILLAKYFKVSIAELIEYR